MAHVIKPPSPLRLEPGVPSVFLAGSIDLGAADDWQSDFERRLAATRAAILNPRRDAWDSSWRQSMSDPNLRAQVEWELSAQELATCIAMYFVPTSKAPITLLELGLFARTGKVIVCCPWLLAQGQRRDRLLALWRTPPTDARSARRRGRASRSLSPSASSVT